MKLITLLIVAFLFTNGIAQENNLFKSENGSGGFGGFSIHLNQNRNISFLGEGAWLIGNFYFGGFGHGTKLGSNFSPISHLSYDLTQSSGGLMMGAFSNTSNKLAVFLESKFAFSTLKAGRKMESGGYEEYKEKFTSITPTIGLRYAASNAIQIKFYAGYQFSSKVNLLGLSNAPINQAVFGIGLLFGSFQH